MSKVIVFTNLTLDGVMQAPRRPDEDLRGDFSHGGWAVPYAVWLKEELCKDLVVMGKGSRLLFERRPKC
jgi:hypothetical protein